MRQKHQGTKLESATFQVSRPISDGEKELALLVASLEYKTRWPVMMSAWLCIALGFAFCLIRPNPETGDIVVSLGDMLTFWGGFGGFMVLVGALILYFARPKIKFVFKGNEDVRVRPSDE